MPNRKIDISLLQTFHLVAKTGSFSAAARALNISYQSAANHVRRLEQMYGTQLVETEKGSRKIELTRPGKALHFSLGSELDTILARISFLMRDIHSIMRIGVPQALFHHFFPEIVVAFRQHHPDHQLIFFERDTTLETMMQNGELDVCISERFFGEPGISQLLIGEYRLVLAYPADWGKLPDADTHLESIRNKPFITYEPGQTVRARATGLLTELFGKPPNITTTASGSTSVMALVSAGIGFALVPEWAAEAQNVRIVHVPSDQQQTVKVYFGCAAFLERDPLVDNFFQTCKQVMNAHFSN